MKTCFKCYRSLPLSEFYKHSAMADGHLNKCRACAKKDVHIHRENNLDSIREYDRQRAKFPHRLLKNTNNTKRSRSQFPKKYAAHNAVNAAVRSGRLERQLCERCGSLRVHAHHEDYSKPLEVMWLCPAHHKERHKEIDSVAAKAA
jgi:hypothetical protein